MRGYKGKEAARLVTCIDPGWSRWSPRSAATSGQAAEELTVETLNRLRAMVGLPKYLPPMPRPPTGDRGWMA